jgi:hypothetical protein
MRRLLAPGSQPVMWSQSCWVRNSALNAAGMWMKSAVSGGPASTSRTRTSGSSLRRLASTQPAEPAPTIT